MGYDGNYRKRYIYISTKKKLTTELFDSCPWSSLISVQILGEFGGDYLASRPRKEIKYNLF